MNKLTEAEKAEFAKAMKEMDKAYEKVDKMVDKILKLFQPDPVEDYEDGTEAI